MSDDPKPGQPNEAELIAEVQRKIDALRPQAIEVLRKLAHSDDARVRAQARKRLLAEGHDPDQD